MLGSPSVAAQLLSSQEGLISMKLISLFVCSLSTVYENYGLLCCTGEILTLQRKYLLHLCGQRVSQAGFMLCLLFGLEEDEGSMFFQNVGLYLHGITTQNTIFRIVAATCKRDMHFWLTRNCIHEAVISEQ
jgi:hypothetical protein